MSLRIGYLILETESPVKNDPVMLRGYIEGRFPRAVLHNHHEKGYLYSYPRLQYKIINGTPYILGIEEGARILHEISPEVNSLVLGYNEYRVTQKAFLDREIELTHTNKMVRYKFVSPWLALNEENYEQYKDMNHEKRRELLKKILVANVLSMCSRKSLNIWIEKQLFVSIDLEKEPAEYKKIPMEGFTGDFEINFLIPDLFGLGKGVSKGFGAVRSIKNDDNEKRCAYL